MQMLRVKWKLESSPSLDAGYLDLFLFHIKKGRKEINRARTHCPGK